MYITNCHQAISKFKSSMVSIGLTTLAYKAVEFSLTDSKVSSIVNGAGLIGIGCFLVNKSGISKQLVAEKRKSKSNMFTTSNKVLACVGIAMACVGVYMLYHSILRSTSVTLESDHALFSACKKELVGAKKEIAACPAAKKLWQEVKAQGPFSVQCDPVQGPYPAKVSLDTREILVSSYKAKEEWITNKPMAENIVFELNNFKNFQGYKSLEKVMCEMEPREYAYKVELHEFGTATATDDIINTCTKNRIWSGPLQAKRNLEDHLAMQEVSGHTDAYHIRWFEECFPEGLGSFKNQLRKMHDLYGNRLPPNI